ncbi:MAG: DMT family transporter [Oscillospiraceae bacterium]
MAQTIGKKTAKLMLFTAAVIWGSTFVIIKSSLDDLDPFFLAALRFSVAAAALALALVKRLGRMDRACIKAGAIIGVHLFLAFSCQAVGLTGTTPSKNAFLSSWYSALVPLLGWLFYRSRVEKRQVAAALLCVLGVGVISLNGGFSVAWGDVLSLFAAFFYATQILATEKYARGHDILLITMLEFAFAGLYAWALSLARSGLPDFAAIPADTWLSVLYLGVMASSVAFLFQNVGQLNTDPASASLILSLECVFGAAISVLFFGDRLTVKLAAGFALVFLGILYSETGFSFLRRAKARPKRRETAE